VQASRAIRLLTKRPNPSIRRTCPASRAMPLISNVMQKENLETMSTSVWPADYWGDSRRCARASGARPIHAQGFGINASADLAVSDAVTGRRARVRQAEPQGSSARQAAPLGGPSRWRHVSIATAVVRCAVRDRPRQRVPRRSSWPGAVVSHAGRTVSRSLSTRASANGNDVLQPTDGWLGGNFVQAQTAKRPRRRPPSSVRGTSLRYSPSQLT